MKDQKKDVRAQLFVMSTCRRCPSGAGVAHKLAAEGDFIGADMVESAEFPHLTNEYGVFGAPKTVVNEEISFDGTLPETKYLEQVMKARISGPRRQRSVL